MISALMVSVALIGGLVALSVFSERRRRDVSGRMSDRYLTRYRKG